MIAEPIPAPDWRALAIQNVSPSIVAERLGIERKRASQSMKRARRSLETEGWRFDSDPVSGTIRRIVDPSGATVLTVHDPMDPATQAAAWQLRSRFSHRLGARG